MNFLQILQHGLKPCSDCGEMLPLAAFHKRTNRKGVLVRRAQCRICVAKKKTGNPEGGKRVKYA